MRIQYEINSKPTGQQSLRTVVVRYEVTRVLRRIEGLLPWPGVPP
jgi:hypothetical protein